MRRPHTQKDGTGSLFIVRLAPKIKTDAAVDKINMLLSLLMLHFITARRPLPHINTCIQDHLPTTGSSQSVAGPSPTFSLKVMIRIDSDTQYSSFHKNSISKLRIETPHMLVRASTQRPFTSMQGTRVAPLQQSFSFLASAPF